MKKGKILLVVLILAIVFLAVWCIKNNKKILNNIFPITDNSEKSKTPKKIKGPELTTNIIISDIEKIQKIDLENGEVTEASTIEKNDLSDFQNFPKLGDVGGEYLQQGQLLKSKMHDKAIVEIFHYKYQKEEIESNDPNLITGIDEFTCDFQTKSCEKTKLFLQSYDGLDEAIKNSSDFYWSAWDNEENKIIGFLEQKKEGTIESSIYVCDTNLRKCQNDTIGLQEQTTMPLNAISPSLIKLIVASNNKKSGTEKRGELIIYDLDDLSKFSKYDTSSIIMDGEEVGEIKIVAWNKDESKIAIGTSDKVFMLDAEKGGLSLVYMTPTIDDEEYDWNYSSLYLSPDAKFIALVDTDEILDEEDDTQNPELQTINNLKRINLETKKVDVLYSSEGLEMQL